MLGERQLLVIWVLYITDVSRDVYGSSIIRAPPIPWESSPKNQAQWGGEYWQLPTMRLSDVNLNRPGQLQDWPESTQVKVSAVHEAIKSAVNPTRCADKYKTDEVINPHSLEDYVKNIDVECAIDITFNAQIVYTTVCWEPEYTCALGRKRITFFMGEARVPADAESYVVAIFTNKEAGQIPAGTKDIAVAPPNCDFQIEGWAPDAIGSSQMCHFSNIMVVKPIRNCTGTLLTGFNLTQSSTEFHAHTNVPTKNFDFSGVMFTGMHYISVKYIGTQPLIEQLVWSPSSYIHVSKVVRYRGGQKAVNSATKTLPAFVDERKVLKPSASTKAPIGGIVSTADPSERTRHKKRSPPTIKKLTTELTTLSTDSTSTTVPSTTVPIEAITKENTTELTTLSSDSTSTTVPSTTVPIEAITPLKPLSPLTAKVTVSPLKSTVTESPSPRKISPIALTKLTQMSVADSTGPTMDEEDSKKCETRECRAALCRKRVYEECGGICSWCLLPTYDTGCALECAYPFVMETQEGLGVSLPNIEETGREKIATITISTISGLVMIHSLIFSGLYYSVRELADPFEVA